MSLEQSQPEQQQQQMNGKNNVIPLNFEDLWDRGETVRKHSSDRRKLFEEFTNLLSERAGVESDYAKSIMRICNNMRRLSQSKGNESYVTDVGGMITLYSNELQQRAQLSTSLSDNIRDYVVEYLRQILKEQDTNAKLLFSESKRLEKELQTSLETLEKTRIRYLKLKRDLDDLQVQNQIFRVTSSTVQDKKDKHRLKVAQTEREVAEFKYVYQESLKNYNDCIESFYPDQWKVMQSFQKQEEERNERIHDGILKMLMFEASFFKNVEFQTQLFADVLHKLDLTVDEKKFIEQNRSNKPLYQQIQYEQFVSFIDCSMERIKEANQNSKFDASTELMIKKSIEEGSLIYENESNESNDKTKYVLDLIIKAWNDQIITPEQFNEYYHKTLEDNEYVKIFTSIMQQFRIQNKFTLNTQGFLSMTYLFNCSLNACFKFRDSKYSRQLLVLSFTYYTINKQEVQQQQISQLLNKEDLEDVNKQLDKNYDRTLSQSNQSQSTQINTLEGQAQSLSQENDSNFDKENINEQNQQENQENNDNKTKIHEDQKQNGSTHLSNQEEQDQQIQEESKANGENQQVEQSSSYLNSEISQKEIIQTKIYLYQQILNHHLWKSRDFWESAIFDSAFEELKGCSELRKHEMLKESQQREKNMCFGQFVALIQNMLLLEIDKREIRYLLQKFAKLFYLTEEQLKSLNQTIDQHMYQNQSGRSSSNSFVQ